MRGGGAGRPAGVGWTDQWSPETRRCHHNAAWTAQREESKIKVFSLRLTGSTNKHSNIMQLSIVSFSTSLCVPFWSEDLSCFKKKKSFLSNDSFLMTLSLSFFPTVCQQADSVLTTCGPERTADSEPGLNLMTQRALYHCFICYIASHVNVQSEPGSSK